MTKKLESGDYKLDEVVLYFFINFQEEAMVVKKVGKKTTERKSKSKSLKKTLADQAAKLKQTFSKDAPKKK